MKKVSLGQTQFGRLVCENRYKFAIICKREKRNKREKTKCACFLQLLFNHSRNLSQQEMWRPSSLNPAAEDDVFPFEAVSKALRVSRTGSRRTKHSLKNSDAMLSLCHSLLSCISLASLTSTSNIFKFRDVYRNLGTHLFRGIDVLVLPFIPSAGLGSCSWRLPKRTSWRSRTFFVVTPAGEILSGEVS